MTFLHNAPRGKYAGPVSRTAAQSKGDTTDMQDATRPPCNQRITPSAPVAITGLYVSQEVTR